jgi:hypothetical protein
MAHIILLAICKVVTARAIVNTENHYFHRDFYLTYLLSANARSGGVGFGEIQLSIKQDKISFWIE